MDKGAQAYFSGPENDDGWVENVWLAKGFDMVKIGSYTKKMHIFYRDRNTTILRNNVEVEVEVYTVQYPTRLLSVTPSKDRSKPQQE